MKISSVMGRMTLRERKMLHESVKRRISEGDDAAAVPPPAEPSDISPVGSTLSKDGNVIFKKTQEGWKTTLRIREDEILDLVRDDMQDEIKRYMRAARGQGDEIRIAKASLKDPGAANKSDILLLQRDGDVFADPVPVKISVLRPASEGLKYSTGTETMTDGDKTRIGNATISINKDKAILSVPAKNSDLSGFDDLFGTSNDGKIRLAIQKAAKTKNPGFLKIPLSWAMDGSIMKFMSDNILRGLGIGKIKFELDEKETYNAAVELNSKEIDALKAELENRVKSVKAKF